MMVILLKHFLFYLNWISFSQFPPIFRGWARERIARCYKGDVYHIPTVFELFAQPDTEVCFKRVCVRVYLREIDEPN
jgi:hypothetical protein